MPETKSEKPLSLKAKFLDAPDGHIANEIKPLIKKWTEPAPTALELLETLDMMTHAGGASAMVILVIENLLKMTIAVEQTTEKAIYKIANDTWRKTHV